MFKKRMALMMTLSLLFTSAITLKAAEVDYSDVTSDDWYYSSLGSMSENNIISGYPDGTFRGSDTLQVDQFLAILCRLTANDVGLGDLYWAQNYIDFAQSEGWLDGLVISDYSKPINRFETARLTVKALGYTTDTYPSSYEAYDIYIEDFDEIPYYYKDDVLVNYTLGITRGYPNNTFQGYNTLTRSEGAVISHRIFDEDVRKPPLVPDETALLMALFAAMPAAIEPIASEVVMPGPVMSFPMPSSPTPVPLTSTPLETEIAVISESVLADAIIDMADSDTGNLLGAGYNYGVFNINLLTEDYDSLLIYTTEVGSSIITIDLLQMTDEDGSIPEEAVALIRLICQNVDYDNSEAMLTWILDNYKNRDDIPIEGNDVIYDTTLMGISSLIHDHNVLKVSMQTNVSND